MIIMRFFFYFCLFSALSSDIIVKGSLLPCLVELSSDENMLVRASAVDSVVRLITFLNSGKFNVLLVLSSIRMHNA